ncbi:threonine synthase [Flavobacteriaceae bacterium F08102]|nr:threonine synthase [Flavobacteriaceae bacterium F08102]
MIYYSLRKNAPNVSFREAVIKGIAEDKGLYFPTEIHPLNPEILKNLNQYTHEEIAFEAIKQFVGDTIPTPILREIIAETLCFDFPIVPITNQCGSLELFHGPTMAFKDVGARFMARCLGYFNRENQEEVTVLVATSGDTGGAVASGFLGVKNVKVVILYPSKKVSAIQEKQLTGLGQNIRALEVDGTFDDCQAMVKQAFLDEEITRHKKLTSANSINVARWLPQMFYYFFAMKELSSIPKKISFSVPSGNYGNICAGMMAKRLGLPIHKFIAATNRNDVVPRFMETGVYNPSPSIQTISNAMDVGDPSNFIRIQELHRDEHNDLHQELAAYRFTDDETRAAIAELFQSYHYIADPHGAIAYLGAKKYLESHPSVYTVFLETAHPVKFLDIVAPIIDEQIELPSQIKAIINAPKKAQKISRYEELKSYLRNEIE